MSNHRGSPAVCGQQNTPDPVTDTAVMALTMLGFEGNFLVSSQLYFHGYEHDPYRLQNQASSLITGIKVFRTGIV
ncbi:hypothetical protein [Candidatus Fukatsuia symbiotica]|uniref:hypothetical protein n=1 Tax=Candidatus Fukatsuia symbiotica TaxID=1878942 RepID=UPI0020B14CBF|nr:hypothetical protein [Candidatus Fukatsuia symbiotica]